MLAKSMATLFTALLLLSPKAVRAAGADPQFGGLIQFDEVTRLKRWCQDVTRIDVHHGNMNYWKGCGTLSNARPDAYDHVVNTCWQGNQPGTEPVYISCAARCDAMAIVWAGYAWRDATETRLDACVFCECVGYRNAVDWRRLYLHSTNPPVSLDDLTGLDP